MKKTTNNDAGFTAAKKIELQQEINSRKVSIDRSVFNKTEQEKNTLKKAKQSYKKYNK